MLPAGFPVIYYGLGKDIVSTGIACVLQVLCIMLISIRLTILYLAIMFVGNAYAAEKPVAPNSIDGAVTVSAEEVIKLIFSNPHIVLIDSRKNTEYLKGHIEGALNHLNTVLTSQVLYKHVPNKSAAVLFYCNGIRCMRSSDSVKKALGWGYTNVFWFRGGWDEWMDKRFPVITGEYLYPKQ